MDGSANGRFSRNTSSHGGSNTGSADIGERSSFDRSNSTSGERSTPTYQAGGGGSVRNSRENTLVDDVNPSVFGASSDSSSSGIGRGSGSSRDNGKAAAAAAALARLSALKKTPLPLPDVSVANMTSSTHDREREGESNSYGISNISGSIGTTGSRSNSEGSDTQSLTHTRSHTHAVTPPKTMESAVEGEEGEEGEEISVRQARYKDV
jgi:hypothetical protein